MQHYLLEKGFQRGKRSGKVRINPEHIAWRNHYLRALSENRSQPSHLRLQEIYTDESCIHHHHRLEHINLFHPSQKKDYKSPYKGKRFCFIAAIRGNVKTYANSFWVFCLKEGSKHKGDYHKGFNSSNYIEWFSNQLLPNLHEPSSLILDNVAYHKTKTAGTPNASKLKKSEVLLELQKRSIKYHSQITAVEAQLLLRNWVSENVRAAIVELAEEAGHKILFTPLTKAICSRLSYCGLVSKGK